MAISKSGQKFIARNRAPRVQIEYDVEIYGAERKIQLPFVMGVMSDLVGKPVDNLPPVDERKFLDIDIDNFDERMKALKPRVAFNVDNTLTGEGKLNVDLTFDSMEDFLPDAANGASACCGPRTLLICIIWRNAWIKVIRCASYKAASVSFFIRTYFLKFTPDPALTWT